MGVDVAVNCARLWLELNQHRTEVIRASRVRSALFVKTRLPAAPHICCANSAFNLSSPMMLATVHWK